MRKYGFWLGVVLIVVLITSSFVFAANSIKVLVQGADPITNVAQKAAVEFKKLSGYDVQIVTSPYSGIFDKLRAELAAPTGSYDVAVIDILWIPFLTNGLVPINDIITDNMKNDFYPGLLEGGSYNNTIYGMPAWTNDKALLYREDLFNDPDNKTAFKKEYSYELEVPSNWKEFRDTTSFFTRDNNNDGIKDLYGTVIFGADADAVTSWLDFAAQAGARPIITDGERNMLAEDPEPYIEGLKYLTTILNKDESAPKGALEMLLPQGMSLFHDGKVAMMLVWGHFYIPSNDPNTSKVANKVGVAPMISGSAGIGAIPGPWYYVIPKSSKNKEVAKKYLKFMYEHNEYYMQSDSLGLAARKSVFEEYMDKDGYAHLKALATTLSANQTQNRPTIKTWEEISNEALLPAVQFALRGEKTPEEAVNWAAKQLDNILK